MSNVNNDKVRAILSALRDRKQSSALSTINVIRGATDDEINAVQLVLGVLSSQPKRGRPASKKTPSTTPATA